jgi:hypothetical protein
MRKEQLLALTACLIGLALPASEAGAATYVYNVDISRPVTYPGWVGPSPDFVQGTITTDCNNCVMLQSDIVDWNLTIAVHGVPSTSLLGPLSGSNSNVVMSGAADVVATSVGLFFNFSAPGEAYLVFQDPTNNAFLQFDGPGANDFAYPDTISWGIFNQPTVWITPYSDQIGTAAFGDHDHDHDPTAGVPEPSTWALMLLGFAGLAFLAHRRRREATKASA